MRSFQDRNPQLNFFQAEAIYSQSSRRKLRCEEDQFTSLYHIIAQKRVLCKFRTGVFSKIPQSSRQRVANTKEMQKTMHINEY